MRLSNIPSLILAFGLPIFVVPTEADACGGTFCDGGQGPQSMPVDQTGETIVYVIDENQVEAHIQIQYDPTTEASQFAWVLPLAGVPSFEVGSQQLFLNLLNSTVPSYGYTTSVDFCGGGDGWGDEGGGDGWWDGCDGTGGGSSASSSTGGGGTSGGEGDDGGTTAGGADVLAEGTVGAFDMVVIEGQNAEEVMTWLGDNGYTQDPAAEPILQDYVDDGFVFAAFRLTQGAELGEIHPIVVTYEGTEPCVPIRLTQIAAQDDMQIRTFFLSDERVVPTNYRHVTLNPLKIDWFGLGDNYDEVITMAVDGPGADGHAFVTEFAGSTDVVDQTALFSANWNADVFEDIDPLIVIDALELQGLLECNGLCQYNHALILGLLQAFLPAPDGVDEQDFYACVACFEDLIDPKAWDGPGFAIAMRERIIQPGQHAVEILDTWPTLTRMYTTLSPHEMTLDPTFGTTTMLPSYDQINEIASRNVSCSGSQSYDLPVGWTVDAGFNNAWPDIAPDEMPWALTVEMVPPEGPIEVVVDNTELITELLAVWNASQSGYGDRPQTSCHGEDGGQNDEDAASKVGCGCRSDGGAPIGAMIFALAWGLGRRFRRR